MTSNYTPSQSNFQGETENDQDDDDTINWRRVIIISAAVFGVLVSVIVLAIVLSIVLPIALSKHNANHTNCTPPGKRRQLMVIVAFSFHCPYLLT